VRNGHTLLTHGHSRVVLALLQRAVAQVGGRGTTLQDIHSSSCFCFVFVALVVHGVFRVYCVGQRPVAQTRVEGAVATVSIYTPRDISTKSPLWDLVKLVFVPYQVIPK
jgi:hypothetical protein